MTTVFFSGAGISAESGISTYRGKGGIYEDEKGINPADILSDHVQKTNPQLVYDVLEEMRQVVDKAQPNDAHFAIADFIWANSDDTIVITQNVDDLFEKAGIKDVIHLHGEITKYREEKGRSRHDVVLFGEMAPEYARLYKIVKNLKRNDNFVVIGTSGLVVSVNELVQKVKGTRYLNNIEDVQYIDPTLFHEVIMAPASIGVPRICKMIR